MLDPRNSLVSYVFRRTPVPARFSLRQYSPPLRSAEGTTGYCGWRTMYQVINQVRRAQCTNAPLLSLDFVASIWNWFIGDFSFPIYGLTGVPRCGFSIVYLYGTLPYAAFGDGVRKPTDAELAAALEYKALEAYNVPWFPIGDPDRLAVAKELICSGLACHVGTMLNSFPFNGGVVPPQSPTALATQGHAMTLDEYDDDGFSGAGMIGGTTNGIAPWSMQYADFLRFCSVNATLTYVPLDGQTYPFPPPLTGNFMTKEAAIAAWAALDPAHVTQAQKDALAGFAAQLTVEVIVPPVRTEYIVNALPAGQSGPSGVGSVEFTGLWQNSGTPGRYLNDGLFSGTTATDNSPPSTYTFKSPPLSAGNWEAYVWWAEHATYRSATVPITVGGVTKEFNQKSGGSRWVLHGTYPYAEGEQATVTISNANGQAAADAVRFVSA
jgi:hypothetical protein